MKDTAELRNLLEWQEQRWGHDHPKVIAILESLADLLQMQGRYGEAEPFYWQILEKKHKQFGPNDLRVADTIYDLACLHEKQENWDECERLYKWTCDIRCRLLPQGDSQLDDSVSKVKEIASKQGHELDVSEYSKADKLSYSTDIKFDWSFYLEQCRNLIIDRNFDSAEKILACLVDVAGAYEPSSKTQAECLHLLGRVHFHFRNFADSLRSFERALALYEKLSGTSSAETAECLEDMADVHCKLGEAAEAEFLFNWALQIHDAVNSEDKIISRLKVKLGSLAALCNGHDHDDEGDTEAEAEAEGKEDTPRSVKANHSSKVQEHANAKSAEMDTAKSRGQTSETVSSLADNKSPQSFDAESELFAGSPEDQVAHFLWTRWINTGRAALEKGDLVGAEMMLGRGLDKANEFGLQDPRLWQTLCEMGELHVKQGKHVKAVSMFNTAQQYCEKTLGPLHIKNTDYWEKLGRTYEKQGDNPQAAMCFDKLVTIMVKANRPLVDYGVYLKKLEKLQEKAPANFFD